MLLIENCYLACKDLCHSCIGSFFILAINCF